MRKKITLIVALALLAPMLLVAGTTRYELGSQTFSFKAGPTLPLFFYYPNRTSDQLVSGIGSQGTHLNVGGYGSISYQAFVNPYVALGGEIGYSFAYSLSKSLYTMVPIQAKATFYPVQGTFEIPISLGFGGAYNRYTDVSQGYDGSIFTMFASVEVGLSFFFNDNWGMGVNCGYWLIPELYSTQAMKDQTALGNFLPITLSVTYRN